MVASVMHSRYVGAGIPCLDRRNQLTSMPHWDVLIVAPRIEYILAGEEPRNRRINVPVNRQDWLGGQVRKEEVVIIRRERRVEDSTKCWVDVVSGPMGVGLFRLYESRAESVTYLD